MRERTKQHAGLLVAVVLAADGALHLYWAAGGRWPAKNADELPQIILDTDKPVFTPSILVPLASALFLGALTLTARVQRLGRIGRLIPFWTLQFGTLLISAGLLTRGVSGVSKALTGERGTRFYRLNLTFYTPVCLVLFGVTLLAARSERPSARRSGLVLYWRGSRG